MSYLCICTFDIKNAKGDDYKNAYADLAKLGFQTSLKSDDGKDIVLPTTTTAGLFSGSDAGTVRKALLEKVKAVFQARGFTSEIFVTVGGNWSWGYDTTQ